MAKHVFVTGGVASSLGKGLTASYVGPAPEEPGVTGSRSRKFRPVHQRRPRDDEPVTDSGEVFVTDDKGEADLDLGHYEHFVDIALTRRFQRHDRFDLPVGARQGTAGRVPRRDRAGHPAHHQRDQVAHQHARQRRRRRGDHRDRRHRRRHRDPPVPRSDPGSSATRISRENVFYVHVTLVPYIGPSGKQKTKPTQHSVTELRSRGIQPNTIVCRSNQPPSRPG